MPTLNQGQYIGEAIRSVLTQEYPNVELIIIDGGSSDGTLSEIKKFNKQLHYWVSEKDNGQSHAINKGLKHASGEIITWLNSDDRYLKGALSKAAQLFEAHPGVSFVHGRAELFGERRFTKTIGPVTQLKPHQYLPYMRFPQPASFFARESILAVLPVNENLHYCMDFEAVVRCLLLNGQAVSTNAVLSGYRLHHASKTNHEERFLKEWTDVLLNIFESVNGGNVYAKKMKGMGFDDRKSVTVFPCKRKFTNSELSEVFVEHLNLHFHYHYRNMNTGACQGLYEAIKEENSDYAARRQYRKYLFRLRYLPALLKIKRRLVL